MSRVYCMNRSKGMEATPLNAASLERKMLGAIEGTRTPTPLPVHGPEPCASANSATMASGQSVATARKAAASGRPTPLFYKCTSHCQTEQLLQLGVHCDLRVQNFGNRAAFFRRLGVFLEGGRVGARHFADHINVAGGDGPSGIQFLE